MPLIFSHSHDGNTFNAGVSIRASGMQGAARLGIDDIPDECGGTMRCLNYHFKVN